MKILFYDRHTKMIQFPDGQVILTAVSEQGKKELTFCHNTGLYKNFEVSTDKDGGVMCVNLGVIDCEIVEDIPTV